MSPACRRRVAIALIFLSPGFMSANYIGARASVGLVEPHMLAFLRWLCALGLMLPLALPALVRRWPQWRREWRQLLVLGGLGMWICGAFVYLGAQTTSATNIGLLYALSPVLIALVSARVFGDRLGAPQLAGAAIALAGMLFLLAQGSLDNLLAIRLVAGDGWIAVAVAAWTAYSVLLRRWPSALDPFSRLAAITMGGLAVLAPFTLAELWIAGPPAFDAKLWLLVGVLALLPGFGAYQSYSFIQRELGPARTGLVLYLAPVWAAAISWLLLGEPPKGYHFAGAALILPGLWLATRRSG